MCVTRKRRRLAPCFAVALLSLVAARCDDLAKWIPTPAPPVEPYEPLAEPPPEPAAYVNIQVDAEQDDIWGIRKIVDEFKSRGLRTTIYVSGHYANRQAMYIRECYQDGFEIALHGFYTGEQLATMIYEEQKNLLERALQAVEGCQPCGTYKPVTGFRPQYFSQNEDTYRVLDELGITHNSGFKEGLLFLEGHDQDAAPYPVPEHGFYAVPITVVPYAGRQVYLCDIACAQNEGFTGEQWGEVLELGFNKARQNKQPLVVLVHGWYTGDDSEYDYWEPFVDFLDEIQDEAAFVTTQGLVELYAEPAAEP